MNFDSSSKALFCQKLGTLKQVLSYYISMAAFPHVFNFTTDIELMSA